MKTQVLTIVLAVLALIASVLAAPGDLDSTFSLDGKLTDGVGRANGVVIQPDGKIVVAGEPNFSVARYNPDGSPDITFGGNGRVTTTIGSDFAAAIAVAVQPDGKIVVAGYACPCDKYGAASFALVRYNLDGSLDQSFDGDGKVTTTIGARASSYSVAIQLDNKIIVAGSSWEFETASKTSFALARYNSDGSLDMTFDGDGKVTTSICSNCNDGAFSVALQPDGKIVAVGGGFDGTFNTKFEVVRYNADGSLDTTFSSDGIVITPIGIGEYANAVTTQVDGKIVVAGVSWNSSSDFALVRYDSNGSLDTTFDSDGKVTTPMGSGASIASIAIQSDGKIVAAGTRYNGSNNDFALSRYNPNGSLDDKFGGGDGITTADFDISNDNANGMAPDSAGRAVVVGVSNGRFAIARFLLAPPRAIADFDGDGRADISVFRSSDRTWYLNRSTDGFAAAQFGLSTDKITPADYDGDGKTDIAVYRDGFWYWLNSSNGNFNAIQFGLPDDIPLPADFTGDGRAELAVYRSGNWYTLNLSNNQFNALQFGLSTDKPVVGDYDGDSRADYAVYRDGIWYLLKSTQGFAAIQFGISTDKLAPADYDGDGETDIAVYREGIWYLLGSQSGFTAFQFGIAGDIPAPADYDGDGRADAAVFRDGMWYLRQSANGFAAQQFGVANDKPVPSAYAP